MELDKLNKKHYIKKGKTSFSVYDENLKFVGLVKDVFPLHNLPQRIKYQAWKKSTDLYRQLSDYYTENIFFDKNGKMYILMLYNVEANRISLEQEQAKKYMQILDTADIQKIWINAYIF